MPKGRVQVVRLIYKSGYATPTWIPNPEDLQKLCEAFTSQTSGRSVHELCFEELMYSEEPATLVMVDIADLTAIQLGWLDTHTED